jgi:hypothetical protein
MAIIYSYPLVASLQTTDLFIISRVPTDPDEISNFSVTLNSISTYIIDQAFNGTDNYIPKFDGTNSLVNSLFYETDTGRVGLGTTTPSRKLQVVGDAIIDTDLEVDGGLDVAGTVRLGFTGNDPVILGDPNGKRTEWNNPGYLEIYAENPDSPGDFNETVDIDGEFLGGGYVGVYPVRTENRHGVRMHSRDATGIEANYIDIASVESSAVYDEDQIRLITAVSGIGTYAGIKISHPTDNRFRFNSEFNTEPTVPFLVDDSAKFTGQVTIPLTPIANTDAASKGYVDTKVDGTGTTNTLPLWSDGPNGILGDSIVSESGTTILEVAGSASIGNNSITHAPGFESIAAGNINTVLSSVSFAFGYGNTANAFAAFAGGGGTETNGIAAIAYGNSNQANGSNSVAFGSFSTASGDQSFAAGDGSTASGQNSMALGGDALAQDSLAGPGVTVNTAGYAGFQNLLLADYAGLNYVSDAQAAAGGVPLGGIYHNAGDVKIRLV